MENRGNSLANQPRELVLYSDVDGTLIGRTGEISSAVIHEIEQFVEAGHGFTLATGRSFRGVKRLLQQIPVNTPLVLCNGAYVYDPQTGQTKWSSLSRALVQEVLSLLQSLPDARLFMERSDNTLWVSDSAIVREPYVLKEDLQPQVFDTVEQVFADGDVLKMGVHFKESESLKSDPLQNLISHLSNDLESEVSWCFSSTDYLEVMSIGTSKWSGIQNSQSLRGCKDNTIVTVGDHHNDVEMIHHADIGIAMGNAVKAVKEGATRCIGHVDDNAVGKLLAELRSRSKGTPARVAGS